MNSQSTTHPGHQHPLARWLGMVVIACVCMCSSSAIAQRVLIVLSSDAKPYVTAAEHCEKTLKSAGIEFERVLLTKLSHSNIQAQTDPVVAIGGAASSALSKSLPDETRLYYCMASKPDQIGLTNRTNTSGLSTEPDLQSQVELIKESGIRIRKIGYLYRSSNALSEQSKSELQAALPAQWTLVAVDLDQMTSSFVGIEHLIDADIDLIWTSADPSTYDAAMIKALLLESLKNKVPVYGFSHGVVRAGSLFGIGIDPSTQGEKVANMLKQKLVEAHFPAAFELAINQIVADRIGVKLDDDFVRNAPVSYKSN